MAFAYLKHGPKRVGRGLESRLSDSERSKQERGQPRWGILFAVLASAAMWSLVIALGVRLVGR